MALKYCSHGNTYDGDGTTTAQAASDGATGAWNNLRSIMLAAPTYGSLAAGDTVHIQSKVGGSDVTINMATTGTVTCHAYGTNLIPIVWKVDDGTIWSGSDGIVTMNCLGSSYDLILGRYGIYDGNGERWVMNSTGTTAHNINWLTMEYCVLIGVKTTLTNTGTSIGTVYSRYPSSYYDCYFDLRRSYTTSTYSQFSMFYGVTNIVNCEFHVDDTLKADSDMTCFGVIGTYGIAAFIFGGKVTNIDAGRKVLNEIRSLFTTGDSRTGYLMKGFNYNFGNIGGYSVDREGTDACIMKTEEMDGIPFDFYSEDSHGYTTWQKNKNYPVLTALLPDDTAWSVKNFAGFDTSFMNPMEVLRTTKYYNLAAAAKKLTVNFLVKDTASGSEGFASMINRDWFIIVTYRDSSTGNFITQLSPIDDTALTTSDAIWVPKVSGNIVYGGNSYNAHKIVLNTTNSIKQNSLISVVLITTRKALSDLDFNFADPDFAIEAI